MKTLFVIGTLAFGLMTSNASESFLLQQQDIPTIDLSSPTPVAAGFKAAPIEVSGVTPVPETAASAAILALGFLLMMRRRSA